MFEGSGVNFIQYTGVRNSTIQKTLNNYGFVDPRYKTYIFYSPNQNFKLESITSTSPDQLHFTYGDYDYI